MKDPKEEAQELYGEYITLLFSFVSGDVPVRIPYTIRRVMAKECVKVAIQLLFDANFPGYPSQAEYDEWAEHWNQTLIELNKL